MIMKWKSHSGGRGADGRWRSRPASRRRRRAATIRVRPPMPQTLKGKRVVLVPMAMGFDLAQGWAAYLKREVEGWGGVFETRDPNWSTEAAPRRSPR